LGAAAAGAVAVEQREEDEDKQREKRPARHSDDQLEGFRIACIGEQDRHIDDGKQHEHAADNAESGEGEGAKIEAEETPPLRFLIGDIESGEHGLRQIADAPHR
jgi:hypothetical protein